MAQPKDRLTRARAIFFAEAREQCQLLESTLLAGGNDAETCQRLFRTAHTIKGSAGMFGLTELVHFTHLMENLLEGLRQGRLPLDRHLQGLLLRCKDHLQILIDAGEREEALSPAELAAAQPLLLALGAPPPSPPQSPQPTSPAPATASANPHWQLSLRFEPDLFRKGFDPLALLACLGELGELRQVQAVWREHPAPALLDASECFLGLELSLASAASQTQIAEIFEFIQDDSFVGLLAPQASLQDYRQMALRLSERCPQDPNETLAAQLQRWQACAALTAEEARRITPADVEAAPASPAPAPAPAPAPTSTAIASPRPARRADQQQVRVEAAKLDRLITRVGELVIAIAGTELTAKQGGDALMQASVAALHSLVEGIREDSLTLRMVPIAEVFERFQRLVHEVAQQLGKDIRLEFEGLATEIDKAVVEPLTEALTHLVRNALDHGLETPAQRRAAAKPEQGLLRLVARHEAGMVLVEVQDDGAGIRRERVLARAVAQGLIKEGRELSNLSNSEVQQLIFLPGFSTADRLSELSGRGVGLDVVKRNLQALRGEIEMQASPGQGSVFRLRLPLTLSIVEGFRVEVNGASYVMPLTAVLECRELALQELQRHSQQIEVDGEWLPFVSLRELFEQPPATQAVYVVIVQFGPQRAGLVVDRLVGEMQAVIKPLGQLFRALRGISGSTLLGDGRPALVLDVAQLIALARQRESARLSPLASSGAPVSCFSGDRS